MKRMKRLFTAHFAGRPAARIVALYSGVNLFILLPFIALFTVYRAVEPVGVFPQAFWAVVAFIAWHVLLPCLIAAAFYLALLLALRPDTRWGGEVVAPVLAGLLAVALLTLYSEPLLALVVLPLAARTWLRLLPVIGLTLALAAWSVYWDASYGTFAQTSPIAFPVAIFFAIMALIVTAYILFSFELAIRQARAREELDTLYRELDASYQTLSRYRELELEHASLEERTRISRELHDTLGHHLTAQRFDLQVLNKVMPPQTKASAALSRAVDRNAEAIADLRRAVQALRPEKAESTDVVQSLQELVALWSEHARVTFNVCGQERPLDSETALALYRLAQEALTNALKYAPEEKLELSLAFTGDSLSFEARNPAPPSPAPRGSGQGLKGLEERIRTLQGSFFAGREGESFKLWATLPA